MSLYDALRSRELALAAVLEQVRDERYEQDAVWGEQSYPDGTGPDVRAPWLVAQNPTLGMLADSARTACGLAFANGQGTWAHILREEFYEALAAPGVLELREELVQVAAVAVAWCEAIDRRAQVPQ